MIIVYSDQENDSQVENNISAQISPQSWSRSFGVL